MLGVGLVGSRRIWPAQVGWPVGPDGYRRIVWMIKRMIKAHPTENRMARQAALDPQPHLFGLDPVHRSHRSLISAPVLASPAASRVVAEDAYQPLPVQHRVDQVTVEERDRVDVGQPWVSLDVEVGLSGQWRDSQDLVELGQPTLGLG
jgi:hypothetical protein